MAAMPALAFAGDLTIAWPAAGPAPATHYRVFVGDRRGVYDRVIDAGSELRSTVTDLADGTVHYFAVKAFDAAGSESPAFSPELACMPGPRVTSVEASPLHPGGSAWVTLRGANFDPEVQVRSNDPRLRARAAVPAPDGSLSVLVEAAAAPGWADALAGDSGAFRPDPATFSLFNPCRRADAFFEANPRAADLDDSGTVDEADVRAVSAAIGAHRGESGYASAADLDGDGMVDGRDLSRVIALAGAASSRPIASPSAAAPEAVSPPAAVTSAASAATSGSSASPR
jgi:hypothetical protein